MGRLLIAREYKLLLKAGEFQARPTLQSANEFWASRIANIVSLFDNRSEPFKEPVFRIVRFWDTADCALSKNNLILRTREEVDENFASTGKLETTLKLRMPDQFVVASTFFAADNEFTETKFEEDIGPLEIATALPGEGRRVIVPIKRSTRNRFALSTTITEPQRPAKLADVVQMFPGLEEIIRNQETSEDLGSGSICYEYAFKKAKAKFADDFEGKFTLSLWCFNLPDGQPDVAELSYTCKTRDGQMSGEAARGAFGLFIELQNRLDDIADTENTSKTALALPKACAG